MDSELRSRLLYWGVCIPTRCYFTYKMYESVGSTKNKTLDEVGLAFGVVASVGFSALAFGSATRNSGTEQGKIWWQSARPVHAALWTSFTVMKACGMEYNYVPLGIDSALGIVIPFLMKPDFANLH